MPLIPSFSRDQRIEKSLRHSIQDGIAFSIMTGAGESYFAPFAMFLKATTQQVAMLASVPPLLASFTQLLAVYLGQQTGARKNVVVVGAMIQAAALLMAGFLPLMFPDNPFAVLLLCVVVYYVGPNLGAPLWGSLMGAIVPESVRGRFFATRTRLSTIASFSMLIAAGLVLQAFDSLAQTYLGFATIFLIGVGARLVSTWHLSQLHDPPHEHALEGDVTSLFVRGFFKGQSRFLRFSLFYACMQMSVAVSGPLVVIYLLRDLQFSYLELTINTAASVLVQFLVLSRWGRLSDLFGNRIILRFTGFAIPLVPFLWVLSTDFYYLLLVQAFSGLVWSGFSLSASNTVFDLTGQQKRAGLMAVHAVVAGIAVFLGASLGGYLATHLPTSITLLDYEFSWLSSIYDVFIISSLLRLLVAVGFLPRLKEVRYVRPMTYHGLFFRVTRFSPISGVIFEIITRNSRKDREVDQ